MKTRSVCCAFLAAACTATGAVLNPRDCGAKGDGVADDTAALQKAIDRCSAAGGGVVDVPAGTYRTYTLHLKNNVEFRIGRGARILGGEDGLKYPLFEPNEVWNVALSPRHNRRALFYTCGQTNVAITGSGTIDSNADAFHYEKKETNWTGHRWWRKSDTNLTGRVVFFVGCRDVALEDVLIDRPCGWSTWFLDCDRVKVRGLRVEADPRFPNGDGVHLGGCRDVVVSDCDIHSQDDSFVLRSHQEQMRVPRPLERVTIANCSIRSYGACAVRFGWTFDYAVCDIALNNIVCDGCALGFGFELPDMNETLCADPPRGRGEPQPDAAHRLPFSVENCTFSNLRIKSRGQPFDVYVADSERPVTLRGLHFANCTFDCRWLPTVRSRPCDTLRDWRFSNCRFDFALDAKGEDSPNAAGFPGRIDGLRLDGCEWNVRTGVRKECEVR